MNHDIIANILDQHDVVLFMKGAPDRPACGFSRVVSTILSLHQTPFHSIDVLEDPTMRQDNKEFSGWPTFPQLYVSGELIGGCDIVQAMHESGELATLLKSFKKETVSP